MAEQTDDKQTRTATKRRRKKPALNVPPDSFIRAWQQAQNVEALLETLKLEPGRLKAAQSRARYYRTRGVPLKVLRRRKKADSWKALAQLAQRLGQDSADELARRR